MATERDWAAGYRNQALADLRAARDVFNRGNNTASVGAMLLQMAYEKIAKAALLHGGSVDPDAVGRTHKAAVSLMTRLKGQSFSLAGRLGYASPAKMIEGWTPIVEAVRDLEMANPAVGSEEFGSSHPILEYPWQDERGSVRWPERDLAIARRLANNSALRRDLLDVAERLIEEFENIF